MRYFLTLWLLPVSGLVLWLFMSSHDYSFGTFFFSRDMFDLVFGIYSNLLGVDPETLPSLIYRALFVDTLIVAGLFAIRRRRDISAWWKAWRISKQPEQNLSAIVADGSVHPAE
jgi:hypothetical protein